MTGDYAVTDTSRILDIWTGVWPSEFGREFLSDVEVRSDLDGRQASGTLAGTGTSTGVGRYPKMNRSAFPAFSEDEVGFRLYFHERYNDRRRNLGTEAIDLAVADFVVGLSLDDRFSHGVLAEDQGTTCMLFWSPEGRWLVDMDLPDVDDLSALDLGIRREWAARTAQHFRPRVEELLERAGVWYGYRTLEWDWQTRRTEQHSFGRLASE